MFIQVITQKGIRFVEQPDPTDEEKAAQEKADRDLFLENHAKGFREIRDRELSFCDWTQLPDTGLTDEQKALWATYRQALRDLTDLENWPEITYEDWPTAPDGTKAIPLPIE